VVKEGDEVKVKLLGFDDRGKVRLSMKVVEQRRGEDLEAKRKAEEQPREALPAAEQPHGSLRGVRSTPKQSHPRAEIASLRSQ
jgi:hypothetical protein